MRLPHTDLSGLPATHASSLHDPIITHPVPPHPRHTPCATSYSSFIASSSPDPISGRSTLRIVTVPDID